MTNKTWMVVEDNTMLRDMLSSMMTLWGVTPLAFRNGQEVQRWLNGLACGSQQSAIPQLALINLSSPHAGECDVIHRLRALRQTRTMSIVLMSAYPFTPQQIERIHRIVRPELVISKPLPDPADLYTLLTDAIDQRRTLSRLANERTRSERITVSKPRLLQTVTDLSTTSWTAPAMR